MTKAGLVLRYVRLKRNISELKAARRAGLSLESFIEIERSPHSVSARTLLRVFEAIEMNEEELVDFNIASFEQHKDTEVKKSNAPPEFKNVLFLQDENGLMKKVRRAKRNQLVK